MKYVYLLRSLSHPSQRYIGLTTGLHERLKAHNAGKSPHTAKFLPWEAVVAVSFADDGKAAAFERYLKTWMEPHPGPLRHGEGAKHLEPYLPSPRGGGRHGCRVRSGVSPWMVLFGWSKGPLSRGAGR